MKEHGAKSFIDGDREVNRVHTIDHIAIDYSLAVSNQSAISWLKSLLKQHCHTIPKGGQSHEKDFRFIFPVCLSNLNCLFRHD